MGAERIEVRSSQDSPEPRAARVALKHVQRALRLPHCGQRDRQSPGPEGGHGVWRPTGETRRPGTSVGAVTGVEVHQDEGGFSIF